MAKIITEKSEQTVATIGHDEFVKLIQRTVGMADGAVTVSVTSDKITVRCSTSVTTKDEWETGETTGVA